MALNKILMAGVALPFMTAALVAQPASAVQIRPAVSATVQSPVILVQDSGEVLDENGQPVDDATLLKKHKKKKKNAQAEEQAPAAEEQAPAVEEQAPAMEDPAPAVEEPAPAMEEPAPAEEEPAPAVEDQAQPEQNQMQEEQAPAVEEQAPAVEEPAPAVEDQAPAAEEQAPAAEDQAPAAEDQAPATEDAAPAAEEQAPATEDAAPAAEDQAPAADEAQQPAAEDQPKQDDAAVTGDQPAQDGATDETATPKKKRKKVEQVQSVIDQPVPEAAKEEIKVKETIAENPAKTTEVIELPVVNGNAVLDSEKDVKAKGDKTQIQKRKKQREKVKIYVPQSDKDAQVKINVKITPVIKLRGEKLDRRPVFEQPVEGRPVRGKDDRVIFTIDDRIVIRNPEEDRLVRGDSRVSYEQLRDGRIREVVVRPDGSRVVTIRNRYGEIIRRSRIMDDNREVIIFYSPDLDQGRERMYLEDPGYDLPPMRLGIPLDDYIIDTSSAPDRDYRRFLSKPPVERVERVYSLDEVKYSARIRDKVRRIDLDTINFASGSADVSMDEAASLRQVASAIKKLLAKDPGETFLIEGHTDAVGSDESNLVLSDRRAESVANVLTDLFDIPPENLATQGYGERFLKVDTDGPERLNRRVTIRRVTPLVRPVASAE